jgi:hypothetical protein
MERVPSMRNHLDESSVAQSLDGDRLKGSLRFPSGKSKAFRTGFQAVRIGAFRRNRARRCSRADKLCAPDAAGGTFEGPCFFGRVQGVERTGAISSGGLICRNDSSRPKS